MKKIESNLPFNYRTIKITQSRIGKGLLAIPVSLIDYFPKKKTTVYIAMGGVTEALPKTFTPYMSSSRECRIGGMRDFYEEFKVKDGDEVVVQILDSDKYRILTEKQFEDTLRGIEKEFDESQNEDTANSRLNLISKITNTLPKEALWSEYYRLSNMEAEARKQKTTKPTEAKESAPPSIRKLLAEIYNGKCQITGFGFQMKNGKPYFEVHHIKPELGNHLKNILVDKCHDIVDRKTFHDIVEERFS